MTRYYKNHPNFFSKYLGGRRVTVGSFVMDGESERLEWNGEGIKWKGKVSL